MIGLITVLTDQSHTRDPWRFGYGDLSYAKVSISHEAKLGGVYKTEVRDKSHIPWLVVA